MKKALLFILLIFSFNLFAGIYKVYFKNGGFLVLKEKPDFSKERIIGVTPDGKKILFTKRLVDFEKTEKANKPKKVSKQIKEKKKAITVIPSKPSIKKPPLIITEATIGKKDKEKKDKSKKEQNPWMSWKNEIEEGDLGSGSNSPVEGMSEEEAKKYWRSQFKKVNAAIKNTQDKINAIQEELNRLMTEKLNTDDNIVIMRINGEMQKLEKKKKQLEEKLKKLKKQKEDLKDKARRSGALPGWYRDLI